MHNIPRTEEKTKEELDEIIRIIQASSLSESIKSFILCCIESALWFPHILQKKNISLHRLKVMLFGKSYKSKKTQEKANKNLPSNQVDLQSNKNSNEVLSESSIPLTKSIETLVNQPSNDSLPEEKEKNLAMDGCRIQFMKLLKNLY